MPPSASPARAGGCRVADAPPSTQRRTRLLLGIAAGVLALDQLTKLWAVEALADGPIYIVGPVRFNLTHNTAGAFGLGGAAIPFLALGALVLVVAMAATGTTRRPGIAVSVGLVLGGAVGNLVDRIFRDPGLLRGAVVDFVDLRFWPVFNLADAAITSGCVLLLVLGWKAEE
jgi:signal peptidase II